MSENKPSDDPKLSTTDRVIKCEYSYALFGDRQGFLGYFKCKMVLMSAAKPSVPSAAHWLGHWSAIDLEYVCLVVEEKGC